MDSDPCRSPSERRTGAGIGIAPDSRVDASAGPHKKLEEIAVKRNDKVRRQFHWEHFEAVPHLDRRRGGWNVRDSRCADVFHAEPKLNTD